MAAIPQVPILAQIEFSAEQMMLGGRPLQNLAADLHADAQSWTIDRLDLRAPGATRLTFAAPMQAGPSGSFTGALNLDSSDPDTLLAWLQGREIIYRSQSRCALLGNVSVTSSRVAIEAMKAEIDGGAVEGRLALDNQAGGGSRFDAELKAERLDLDVAVHSRARWPARKPSGRWRRRSSLDIGRATSGPELRPFMAKLGYGPKTISLDQLKRPTQRRDDGRRGEFRSRQCHGRLALNSSATSLVKSPG
jgi:large subunit ribosomal protein L24